MKRAIIDLGTNTFNLLIGEIKNGKLSVNSPIGKGLLGKVVGDIAEIQVPSGIMKFEIIAISR